VEHRRVRREALEAQGPGDVHRVEERRDVGDREGRPARREGVVVEERSAFAGLELHLSDERVGELGHRREIGLADRSDRPDPGRFALVQGSHEPVGQLRPDPGRALGEMIGETQHRCPDDVVRRGGSLADDVVADHPGRVALGLARLDPDPLQDADGGVRAVDRIATAEGRPDDLA
jgi:hypothetical protein